MAKKYLNTNYANDYGWGGYSNFSSFNWGNFGSFFTDREKIVEFKDKVSKAFKENYVPVNVSINGSSTYGIKGNKLTLNFSNNNFSDYNSDEGIQKLLSSYDKVPLGASVIWNVLYSLYLNQDPDQTQNAFNNSFGILYEKAFGGDSKKMLKAVNDYFEGKTNADELMKHIPANVLQKAEEEAAKEINPDGKMKSYSDIGSEYKLEDKVLSDKFLKLIKSKINIQDIEEREITINKGKKLNKGYIEGRDWKPLLNKNVYQPKKKKILFLVDCSGSMGYINRKDEPAYAVTSFLDAVLKSNIFDVTHIYYHSCSGYGDVKSKFLNSGPFFCHGGAEGFEVVDTNIPKEHVQNADYVVALTDLCIGQSAERGLANFLSKCKKNLILSFENEGTLQGLNVRTIPKDDRTKMINSLITILS